MVTPGWLPGIPVSGKKTLQTTPEPLMNSPHWNKKTILRYALLQIPGVLLAMLVLWIWHNYFGLSTPWAWFFLVLWLVKDSVLFFFVWPAYQGSVGDGWYSLVGLRGETRDALRPEGYVRIRGVLWKAKADKNNACIEPGTKVVVVGREGIKLIVRAQKENSL